MSNYDKLTDTEKCHYQAYARLREISDWDGFSEAQGQKKQDARDWLVNQRQFIWRCAEGKETPEYKAGWGIHNRQARYDALKDDALNTAASHNNCQLPTNGGTPSEKAGITEREGWWNWSSVDDQTKAWRQSNADWATAQRKKIWHLAEDEGWDEAERRHRYDNLCVATKTGQAYDEWCKGHNDHTGEAVSGGGKSSRSKCKDWLDSHIGVHENPDGSNRGHEQPSKWQDRVYGTDGVPWCACFAGCSAWDNGVSGSVTAGVANNVSLAKQGKGIYRGWTNDPSKVHAGDHAFVGSDHTGVIYDASKGTTVEGNTSASGGSQWNGGQVAKKTRGWSYWSAGFGLVDFPED